MEAATKVAAVLKINCYVIYKEVGRVQKERNAAVDACATVTPETSESLAMADDADKEKRASIGDCITPGCRYIRYKGREYCRHCMEKQ